jgi:hypothetical protein
MALDHSVLTAHDSLPVMIMSMGLLLTVCTRQCVNMRIISAAELLGEGIVHDRPVNMSMMPTMYLLPRLLFVLHTLRSI